MKKIVILLSIMLAVVSCKKKEDTSNYTKIEAEYIFVDDAAVLKGVDFIYGVVLNEKTDELNTKVDAVKKNQYDMVPVVIEGVIKPNTVTEGWEKVVEIKNIINVSPANSGAIKVAKETIKINEGQ